MSRRALLVAATLFFLPSAHAEDKQLFFYNWTDYFPADLIKKFEAETGIKVTLDGYDSNETLLAKLKSGASAYDVVVPSDYMVKIMINEKLLQPINASTMENFKNVAKPFDNPVYDPGRVYSAPYMWGSTGFTYDTAAVKGGKLENSWKEFFEPREELRGKIGVMNDEFEVYKAAAFYLNISECTEDPKDAQRILDLLLKQKPYVAAYNSDGDIERMSSKEVAMHQQWNGAAHRVKKNLATVVYVYPKEGMNRWADNFAVPVNAPHPENARIFINWIMDKKNIAQATNFTGYMNAINGSEEYMDADLKNDPAVIIPEEDKALLHPNVDCSEKARDLRGKVWTKLHK